MHARKYGSLSEEGLTLEGSVCRRRAKPNIHHRQSLSFRKRSESHSLPPHVVAGGDVDDANDPDLVHMAKAWAFPEDLHLYPVSTPSIMEHQV